MTVSILAIVIHRRSKGKFMKPRTTRFAPALGMPGTERQPDASADSEDYASQPPRLSPLPPPPDTAPGSQNACPSVVFAGRGIQSNSALPQLPPYSAEEVNRTSTSQPVMTEEQRANGVVLDGAATELARRLPSYDDVPEDSPPVQLGRLIFHSQTSQDPLLSPPSANFGIETPVTPPTDEDAALLLGPPPAYSG